MACGRPSLNHPSLAGLPLARVDRITNAAAALALIDALTSEPPIYETLVVLLDHQQRGTAVWRLDNTVDNDSVLHTADHVIEVTHQTDHVGGVIIASVRPESSDELDDVDRWLTIDDQLGLVGIELVEWFVIGRSVSRPRALLGEPERWAA